MLKKTLAVIALATLVAGCQSTGEQYQADVFDASQVNTKQAAKTVTIISVTPAKIKVSNESNRKAATLVGGLIGAVGGGALGAGHNRDTALIGGVAGGATGALAGSMVNDTTLVPGVLLGYSEAGKIYTSTQVGKPCEFAPGKISLMVQMLSNETRIQPNATCPPPAKA
ncbi:hypothetical protein PS870_06412 [Pseudomonas fluorescens]|uniref:Glycine zipper 2TM domain-containing protein n=1 Tax=Pseudomonas fluorescens TaxID=294 RepID=A0A5E7QRT1_PSEFL|nr:hypothetical protein [Pseudomonas fluorescens]VVP61673.1 hypothetical protein PS870_06412 [Pseudomonas fluorescens]